jgi:hypothetical protein
LILDIFNFLSPSAKERFGAYLFLPSKPKDWENYIERKRKQFLKDLAQEREENVEEISKRVEIQARVNHENFKRLGNGEKITVFSVFAFFGL